MASFKESTKFNVEIPNFKCWFNSARFFNEKFAKNWTKTFTVGTKKVSLRIVTEVDGEIDGRLSITICNYSTFDVCFGGTMKATLQMEASNITERILLRLGRPLFHKTAVILGRLQVS